MFWEKLNQNISKKNQYNNSKKIFLNEKNYKKKNDKIILFKNLLLKNFLKIFYKERKKKKNLLIIFFHRLSIKKFFVFVLGRNFFSFNYFKSVHNFESMKISIDFFILKFKKNSSHQNSFENLSKNLPLSSSWNCEFKNFVLFFSIKNCNFEFLKKIKSNFSYSKIFKQNKFKKKNWGKANLLKFLKKKVKVLRFYLFFFRKIKKSEKKKSNYVKFNLSKLSTENFKNFLIKFIDCYNGRKLKKFLAFEIFEKIKYDPSRLNLYYKIFFNFQISDIKIFSNNQLFFTRIAQFINKKKWISMKNSECCFWLSDSINMTKKKNSKKKNFFYFIEINKKESFYEIEFFFILFFYKNLYLELENEFVQLIFYFLKNNQNILKCSLIEKLFIFINNYLLKKKRHNSVILTYFTLKIFLVGVNNSTNKRIFILFPEIFIEFKNFLFKFEKDKK